MKKVILSCIALFLALTLLTGCGAHGKTMMKTGGETISLNVYELYLSRMKGDLSKAGFSVNDPDFWASYVSADNTTYADFYTDQVYEGLRQIAAALALYNELGLTLPADTKKEIEEWIQSEIEAAGGKAELNSLLAAYGANITVLRDASLIEAKVAQLKKYLYGPNGNLIKSSAKEEFYKAVYTRGYQMLIANYYYDHELDEDGRTIYYFDDHVAYDVENGIPDGTIDVRGDDVYRYPDGTIAYDEENGAPNYFYNANGERIVLYYSDEEMADRLAAAQAIAEQCRGDEEKFKEAIVNYSDNLSFNENYAPNGMYFAAGSYTTDTIFATFADQLETMEAGDIVLLSSDNGYYLLMRVELDDGAWSNGKNNRWFSTFTGLAIEYMLQQRLSEYLDKVSVNEKLRAEADITAVGANTRY